MPYPIHITNDDELRHHYATLNGRVHSVTEYMGIIEYRWTMRIHYFRGEPQLYQTPCLPSIWRRHNSTNTSNAATVFTQKEQDVVDNFRGLVLSGKLNDPYFDLASPPPNDSPEWIELAQHYGHPTRLLDVTLDPLVALFFAVSKHDGVDGAVFLSSGSFNTLDPGEYDNSLVRFFSIYTLRDYSPAENTLFLYRPLAKNRRMIAQRGQFVWCRGIGHSLRATDTRIVVAGESKSNIRATLNRIGYTEDTLLPPPI
jgi:hypothetical protein